MIAKFVKIVIACLDALMRLLNLPADKGDDDDD